MTTTALALNEGFDSEKINLIKTMIAKDCSNDELQLFLYTCRRTGLDPLARQIYAIKRSGKMTIQTGIDGYRVIADRTGKLAGISDYSFDDEEAKNPKKATVTVRKVVEGGLVADFTATARWGEYNAGGPMWSKMPFLMLGKCAEALALRKAFPADLSGVYTAEEMAQADNAQQGEAVFAEVARQKSVSYPTVDASEDVMPPELDWSYAKGSGVLICRPTDVKKAKNKAGKEFVVVVLNNPIEATSDAFYWHSSFTDELLKAKGKVCKLIVAMKGKYLNVEEVLEVDGVKMEKSDTSENEARLLASVLEFDEDDLNELHRKYCNESWPATLAKLKEEKIRRESQA
jgi:phage recombination protein Bet